MNELKKLSFDAKIYKDLIRGYTGDPYVNQAVENLIACLESKDISGILLFLERLKNGLRKILITLKIINS
ncbi:hypothetical protein ACP2W0_08400 [Pseudobacillus badius]|uniref:hypothetical protein n=1 Tax=Bacillus badius TaxID=1455 RepID=UPI003CE8EAC3